MKPHHSTVCLLSGLALSGMAHAQDALKTLDPMVVQAESEADRTARTGWLPAVAGASIFSGKKTTVIDLDALPRIVGNNYRQALSLTPSLLLSEESTPLVSIGYRGLSPGRAQYTQVLQDGIPIHADQLGYPEAYYTPPLDTVDRIEFLHGGAALQYGPQPGGALNYITHRPRTDKPFSARTQHVFGSDNLYSTFSSADGTVDRLGYSVFYNHRQSDGPFNSDSAYDLDHLGMKLLYTFANDSKLIFSANSYQEDHEEPGGLSVENFNRGNRDATRREDSFSLVRDSVSLTYELAPTAESFLTTTAWWSHYERDSKRQGGGGFGTAPKGAASLTNSIEEQEFRTIGLDSRYRVNWGADSQHTLAAGIQLYHMDSPRQDSLGANASASSGKVLRDSEREVFYAPVFVENKFTFGDFSVTPGLRVESIHQDVKTRFSGTTDTFRAREVDRTVLLGGLGAEYAVAEDSAIYANVSQSYRPEVFTESVPTGSGQVVPSDLEEGKSIEYELGYRSRPTDWLTLDTSAFLLKFKDQVGVLGNTTANVGDATHKGIDLAVSTDLLTLMSGQKTEDSLVYYFNATLLDAEFDKGPAKGKTPRYAPDHLIRTGLTYSHEEKVKVTLGGTFVDNHYGNDTNTKDNAIPAYMTWDLTAEYQVHANLRLLAGINNLLDESYFSRVTNSGIDPSAGRNVYFGVSLEF